MGKTQRYQAAVREQKAIQAIVNEIYEKARIRRRSPAGIRAMNCLALGGATSKNCYALVRKRAFFRSFLRILYKFGIPIGNNGRKL